MSENQTFSPIVQDRRKLIVSNPDGSYTRHLNYPTAPSSPDPNSSFSPVLSKDITINSTNKTWLRLYLPRHLLYHHRRLPLIVYYHGGGFIFGSADSNICHDFCKFVAERIEVVIASVEYRCAPEHRLPAAYEDSFEALQFIKSSEDDWLRRFADLSSCFLMGTSAGGNISYQMGIRVCTSGPKLLDPLKVKGLVLHHPYFSGSKRTGSELKMEDDKLDATDMLWELYLPVGSDKDHEYSNPMILVGSSSKIIREAGVRVLLFGSYEDSLIDRELELAKALEDNGVMLATHVGKGSHAQIMDLSKADLICSILKDFISLNTTI